MNFNEFSDFVESMLPEIKSIVDKYINHVSIDYKADNSPVTKADKEIEQYMTARIQATFPTHSVMGEESGEHNIEGAEYHWILDPIDGTRSFIHGVPLFATLIGVMHGDEPVFGAIYNPMLNDIVLGNNEIALWNGKPTHVRSTANIEDATLLCSDALHAEKFKDGEKFMNLARRCRNFRTWGDAYGYFLVATGRADIMVDAEMSKWDIIALVPIIRGAGGTITDYHGGNPATGDSIIASNSTLQPKIVKSLM